MEYGYGLTPYPGVSYYYPPTEGAPSRIRPPVSTTAIAHCVAPGSSGTNFTLGGVGHGNQSSSVGVSVNISPGSPTVTVCCTCVCMVHGHTRRSMLGGHYLDA